MRQISQHYLAKSLLKAMRAEDLFYFLGHRDGDNNSLELEEFGVGRLGTLS